MTDDQKARQENVGQKPEPKTDQKPRISKVAKEISETLEAALCRLSNEGDLRDVETIEQLLSQNWTRSSNSPRLVTAREKIGDRKRFFARDFRDAAEKANCEFTYAPPNAGFGCVSLYTPREGEWRLSVLDSFTVQTVRTTNGVELARACFKIIEGVEQVLQVFREPLTDVDSAADLVLELAPKENLVPLNHLMLLLQYGPSLKKALEDPTNAEHVKLSRAAFGFVMCKALKKDQERTPQRWNLRAATQHDAKEPRRYVPVPHSPEPRKKIGHRDAVALVQQGRQ